MAEGTRPGPGRIYHRQLTDDWWAGRTRPAFDWLRHRGISIETINQWKLGYVRHPLEGHERFQGCISIPYFDAEGGEWGVRFRRKHGLPKYDGIAGVEGHLFAGRYSSERVVFITEGEFDCMILHQMRFKAVGVAGANMWKHHWRFMFRACEEIVVVPDADGEPAERLSGGVMRSATKGQLFKAKVMSSLKGLPAHIRVVRLPEGHDVNSLYLEDRDLLRSLLKGR